MLTHLFIVLCLVACASVTLTAYWSAPPRTVLEYLHRFGRFGIGVAIGLIGAFVAQRGYVVTFVRDWPMLLLSASLSAVYVPQALFERRADKTRETKAS